MDKAEGADRIVPSDRSVHVVVFDYWARAADRYVRPLARILRPRGHTVELLHTGSTRGEPTAFRELVAGVAATDYVHFGRSLRRGITELRPDVVMVLNNGGLVDRLVNRICRQLEVPTAFLMHGIPPLAENAKRLMDAYRDRYHVLWRLSRARRRVPEVAEYLRILARERDGLRDRSTWAFLYDLAFSPGRTWDDPRRTADLVSDYMLAWANVYRKHYVEVYGYAPERVAVVGHPINDRAIRFARRLTPLGEARLRRRLGLPADPRLVLFVLDATTEADGRWTEEDIVDEVRAVGMAAARCGAHLIVKRHPSGPGTPAAAERMCDGLPVSVFDLADVGLLTALARCVVGHTSSALDIAITLGRPLLVPEWGPVFRGWDYFVKHGVADPVKDEADLSTALDAALANRRLQHWPTQSNRTYVDEYITHTDGRAWQRIADQLLRVAAGTRAAERVVAAAVSHA